MKKFVIIVLALMFGIINTAEAKTKKDVSSRAEYNYFSHDKNITNLNTQLPAKKGLLEKRESDQIRSVGNYQEKESAPRTHFKINIFVYREENRIALKYEYVPDNQISSRIPIFQQIFREDVPNTHVYFILPKEIILTKEIQTIITINNRTEKRGSLSACSSEDTGFSQLLKKYNAAIEGTYDLTPDEKTQLERSFDNTVDTIGGRTGKGIEIVKRGIKWGIEKDEKRRLKTLREKYGEEYQIYKMPFYVPEGITLAYTHIGRQGILAFNLSELTEPTKIFIEIPQLTFELDASGATRKASIEGLAYEIMVEPLMSVVCNKKPAVVGYDGAFVAYATGVVYDKNTGLEWLAGPDRDTTWDEANTWVANLTVAGRGWRMPTREELRTLYQEGAGTRNMTPLLKTTGWYVLSDDTKTVSEVFVYNFTYGSDGWWTGKNESLKNRGFAVRSQR